MTFRTAAGPDRVPRYNLHPAAEVQGDTWPGVSSGQGLATMERLARDTLPQGLSLEWTDLAYQQSTAGNASLYVFPLCVLFVFLVLAAQYESWALPFAIILIVPMCLGSAIAGVPGWARQQPAGADRLRCAGGTGGQERHPHRRVRQAARGAGRRPGHSRGRGLPPAPAPDPDDVTVFGLLFTPVFYVVIQSITGAQATPQRDGVVAHGAQPVAAAE